jgi:hypothetical protein
MATATRLRGKSGLIWSLKIGTGGTGTNYGDDVKKVEMGSDDADDSNVTFYEVAQGLSKVYSFTVTAVTSYATGSLYMYLWNNPGAQFTLDYAPEGNATATTAKPHIAATLAATGKPIYDLEANLDANYGAEFEYTFNVVGDLTLVTA